jgi:hypothetical protein
MPEKKVEQPEVVAVNEAADSELEDSQDQDRSEGCDPLARHQVGRLPARASRT